MRVGLLIVALFCLLVCAPVANAAPAAQTTSAKIEWNDWGEEAFSRAAKQKRLVLLDVEAEWCHWCHVMREQTYADPAVIALIQKNFVAIRVDQAAHPDLAARYEDYGWPATVVLTAKGEDIWKEAGFIEPPAFLAALNKVLTNPTPQRSEPPASVPPTDGLLAAALREKLQRGFRSALDSEQGGLNGVHRYLRRDVIEYAIVLSAQGDASTRAWLDKTVAASLKLLDPVWGGLYQYSSKSGWNYPHYEKIMSTQTQGLESFVAASYHLQDPKYLEAAKGIHRYTKDFLTSPEGAFYASQDADLVKGQHAAEYFALDDAARRAQGIPAVQKNIFARENGWMISALASLYAATGDAQYLTEATTAARYIQKHRALGGGGFSHGESDRGGPYLSDNVAMLQAFLSLYSVSAERGWLEAARQCADFIISTFLDGPLSLESVGVLSTKKNSSPLYQKSYSIDLNIALARAANLLFQYTGTEEYRTLALTALRYVTQDAVALRYATEPGVLIADSELRSEPLHVTVVANKDDAAGKELFMAGSRYYAPYKRLEWWDKREGALPRADVQYPQLSKAAAFVCTNKRCSLPIFDAQKLGKTIDTFRAKEKTAGL
ncbi:MAG: thioredoxin domain-containing protein [Deltaproteobacteria bacterium]|nr:thioredoxin domain-containing protein [Deltaproteobacteria bacterium]